MGKSQQRRLRAATNRFGREDWGRWATTRAILNELVWARKKEAGIAVPVAMPIQASTGRVVVKRYSTAISHQQNEITYGRPLK